MTVAATHMAGRQLARSTSRLACPGAQRLLPSKGVSNPPSSLPSPRLRRGFATQLKAAPPEAPSRESVMIADPHNNVTENVYSKLGVNLHRRTGHPLCTIREAIYEYFDDVYKGSFNTFDDLLPIVSTQSNFDSVLVPENHVSRSLNDTYYVDANTVLRCHTSAHQAELLRKGEKRFLVTGDVYRRDSVDRTHYPVFHQMEGFRVFTPEEVEASGMSGVDLAAKELKDTLAGLARHLFGDVQCRWVDTYFPFTEPSFELEIYFNDDWLEVLGCGVTQQKILDENGNEGNVAWAFGLGLERLAMVLFEIPDIRLFWSSDKRFLDQFSPGDMNTKFQSFSKFPPVFKDLSFWFNDNFTENNLAEIVRNAGGDLVEEVKLIDEFTNKKTGKTSNCFRITYRSMERSLTNDEINAIQEKVREEVQTTLGVELR